MTLRPFGNRKFIFTISLSVSLILFPVSKVVAELITSGELLIIITSFEFLKSNDDDDDDDEIDGGRRQEDSMTLVRPTCA